jgi:hypothetical protein
MYVGKRPTGVFTPKDWRRFCGPVWRESQVDNCRQAGIGKYEPLPPPPPTGWEEVVLLRAGVDPQADEFVCDLLTFNPILAARCIYEGRASVSDAVRQQVIRALLSLIEDTSDIALRVRIAAGEALGYLGDTRFRFVDLTTGQDVTSDELKARIWRGDKPEDRERYLILPPTVPIDDGGYDKSDDARWRDCWWKDKNGDEVGWDWLRGSGQTAPYFWNDSRFHKPNYPVVGVTWYEAVAYANWLNAKIGQLVNWSISWHYRLPTEAQWEYAARGDERRLFPWGVEPPLGEAVARLCNIHEGDNFVYGTTPVGIFLLGATPNGIFDMAGNVWEWCEDWRDVRKDYRALRGGSWLIGPHLARACARDRLYPDYGWLDFWGIRLVQCRS